MIYYYTYIYVPTAAVLQYEHWIKYKIKKIEHACMLTCFFLEIIYLFWFSNKWSLYPVNNFKQYSS